MSNIESIQYNIGFSASVDKQPTIRGHIDGTVSVKMKDGRLIEDLEIQWDDCPGIQVWDGIAYSGDFHNPTKTPVLLTKEEVDEINILLDDYDKGLWVPVNEAATEICDMTKSGELRPEE